MQIGCHISVAKGLFNAAKVAKSLGAKSFQVFTKNPRGLRPKKINYEDAQLGREFCEENKLTLVTHTPYITNLSTPDNPLHQATIRSITEDLHIAETYGAIGAVVHCGKHVKTGVEAGTLRMIETLDKILEKYDGPVKLLLENTAGQGTELGTDLESLMHIRNNSKFPEKIGFCFDTCHAFAAGKWNNETFDELVSTMKETGYLDSLITIHFNDSKVPYDSRKDRHEKIGKGHIGTEALSKFLQVDEFKKLPIILETPVDDESEYAEEIDMLNNIVAVN